MFLTVLLNKNRFIFQKKNLDEYQLRWKSERVWIREILPYWRSWTLIHIGTNNTTVKLFGEKIDYKSLVEQLTIAKGALLIDNAGKEVI